MKLLIFAHRGEAQSFISYFKLKAQSWTLGQYYTNETDLSLLISGEGIYQTLLQTTAFLSQMKSINLVINLGIAGALKKNFSRLDFVQVRTAYAYSDSAEYKSFSSSALTSLERVDCLSHTHRLTTREQKEKLAPFADIVDREIWAISQVAHAFKIPWQSFKIISDVLEEPAECVDIFEAAKEFSDALLKNFLEVGDQTPEKKESENFFEHPDFHFTFSQRHLYRDTMERLQLKSPGSKIDEVFINSLVEKKLTPKIRTQMLLDHLQEKLNPWMKALKNNLQTTLKPFNNSKLSVQVDPSFESSDISVEFNFQSKQELMENLSQLGQLPVEKIQSLLLGETHD